MTKPEYYFECLGCGEDADLFQYLIDTLQPTNKFWDYFVDWGKIKSNINELKYELNLLNALIGDTDIEKTAADIFKKYPRSINAVPILITMREKEISILEDYKTTPFKYQNYSISEESDPLQVITLMRETGIFSLLEKKQIKSIPDYVFGIEVGLNTNARKNRGGKNMEKIVEYLLKEICRKHNWSHITEATKSDLKKQWNVDITIQKANKRLDFAVQTASHVFLIETNFYNSGGSKLKSTASEYSKVWNSYGHPFIWITDGPGWCGDNSLKDAFREIDHVINLDMVQKGLLEKILLNN